MGSGVVEVEGRCGEGPTVPYTGEDAKLACAGPLGDGVGLADAKETCVESAATKSGLECGEAADAKELSINAGLAGEAVEDL
jgi:phage tail tape-measure protein